MPVIIEANYAKKVGLPAYSSHQFAVTLRTELTDLSQLERTAADLYGRLQAAVDSQIIHPGHVPTESPAPRPTPPGPGAEAPWKCSDRQRDLILKIVDEHALDKSAVESLAQERFGAGVRELNRLQASSLIDELLETHGGGERRQGFRRRFAGRASS
ncbi:MAG: hypothetical protein HZC55_18295 [Verrucomicrobia bacterium]|nr:hypothetical protein [Verrucomicrobiota bacterium]